MTTIVEPDEGQRDLMHAALAGATTLTGTDYLDQHLREHPNEFAVVLGPSVALDDAATFAQWARIHKPTLGVILVRVRIDSSLLSEAMRSGMREVVESRDQTELGQAVRRAHAVAEAMSHHGEDTPELAPGAGRMVTMFSMKGGVGKSLVTTNLGVALAEAGNRVCIVDLDLNGGDVAIMLQLKPQQHLGDLSQFGGAIDEGAVESLLTSYSPNLAVLAAPVHVSGPDQATPDAIAKTLDLLKRMFDFVVIDTSGTFDDQALSALDRTDTLMLVGTLDIPALKSLKLTMGTLDLLNFPLNRCRLVINRADAKVGLSTKEFEQTLGMDASATFPSSREVLAAVNRGEPIVRAQPNHPVSRAVKALAASIASTYVKELPQAKEGTAPAIPPAPARRIRLRRGN